MQDNLNRIPETRFIGDLQVEKDIKLSYKIEDMKKTLPFLKSSWQKQTNEMDKETRFIYNTYNIEDILHRHENDPIKYFDYAIRRYFNKTISHTAEELFCRYNICEKEKNKYHKHIDFWLLGVPFDLKVSSYPARFEGKRENFKNEREYRNELIRWLYNNQSQQQRLHMKNRLFILCKKGDGKNTKENNVLKIKFDLMEKSIHNFLDYTLKKYHSGHKKVFNEVDVEDKIVFSDVLLIEEP